MFLGCQMAKVLYTHQKPYNGDKNCDKHTSTVSIRSGSKHVVRFVYWVKIF